MPVTDQQHEEASAAAAVALGEALEAALDPTVPIGTRILRAVTAAYQVVNVVEPIISAGGNPARLAAETAAKLGDKLADRIPPNADGGSEE